jgi:hypothetical protein
MHIYHGIYHNTYHHIYHGIYHDIYYGIYYAPVEAIMQLIASLSSTASLSSSDSCPPQLHCPLQDSFTDLHRQLVQPVTASAVTGKPKRLCYIFYFNAVRQTLISLSYESSTSGNPGYTGGIWSSSMNTGINIFDLQHDLNMSKSMVQKLCNYAINHDIQHNIYHHIYHGI